ncbi:MAG: hypothetical protein QHH02_02695, partial [Syntrophomonadaceae bacterium]|nr:hypothetical protein [Syntrophomonadaceae bacterium]
ALLKYRTTLFTSNLGVTPSLQELTIGVYSQRYKGSGTLTSAALSGLTLGGAAVSFIVDTPAGTSLAMEYQESDDGVNWGGWAAMDSGQVCGSRQYFRYRASFGTTDDTVSPALAEVSIAPRPYALSPAVDISAANDPNSGRISYSATFPGTAGAALKTRTSADGSTWSGWAVVDGAGNVQSPFDSYLQVLLDLEGDSGANNPTFDWLVLSYDDQPGAVELASGFTAGGQFFFATLMNKLIITNRLDAPKKWDGTGAVTDLGGSPPHAQYVAVHKNYLFMAHTPANPSRLFFSEVLNPESWPALNFIDVSPNDGDWITGLLPHDDYLIIAKNRSFWVLLGSGPSDFQVKRLHADIGCVAPRSLVRMGESFAFVAHDGIYVSDLVQPVVISERLKNTWKGLNRRRLSQAAAAYHDHKLRVELPRGASVINNFRIVFDNIRKALIEEEFTEHYSCYTEFVEAGQEILLAGHASEGQVSQCDSGSTDAGNPINFEWESKHFDFGLPEHIKRWRKVFLALAPAASDTQLKVAFVVEGGSPSSEIAVDIPGTATKRVETVRVLPSEVGVVQGHSLGFRITQSTTNGGVGIHALTLDYFIKGARPTV